MPNNHAENSELSDALLERYARHLILKEIGFDGQQSLHNKKILMVGAGGLGASALAFFASSGVGHIDIIDSDVVALSNLQRQILYTDDDIGKPKCFVAKEKCDDINPHINVTAHFQPCDDDFITKNFAHYDVVCDGSDNYQTRILVNQGCYHYKTPLVSAAIVGFEGQICMFDFSKDDTICYQCLYPKMPDMADIPNCDTVGVFAPLAGIFGGMIASETMKLLLDIGDNVLHHHLLIWDMLTMRHMTLSITPHKSCSIHQFLQH